MADTKISALSAASALVGTEAIPVVQSSTTKKTTPAAIATYVDAAGAAASAVSTHVGLADPHTQYALEATTVSAGSGLTGGGDLSANRSLAVSFGGAPGAIATTGSAGAASTVSRSDHTHQAEDVTARTAASTLTGAEVVAVSQSGNLRQCTLEQITLKNNYSATTDPTVSSDSSAGYAVGSRWINTTDDTVFVCVDASVGAAVWRLLSGVKAYVFTSTTTGWTVPSWATELDCELVGGGGGGGSGRRGASATARTGGGGGAAGSRTRRKIRAAGLPSSRQLDITVGGGGTGGASQSTDSTNGNAGTAGGLTSIALIAGDGGTALARAGGGGAGGAGASGAGAAGGTGSAIGEFVGASGAGSTASGAVGSAGSAGVNTGGGGGPGGGITSGNAASSGNVGGSRPTTGSGTGGGTAGVVGGASPGAGGDAPDETYDGGGGGGGGAGSATGNGQAGGAGGFPGGGGGGGGAGQDGTGASGAGGAGGAGIVVIFAR